MRKLCVSFALVAAALSSCADEPTGPNVVVVVIDTLRADRLPWHGYGKSTAPFLSELAEHSVVFDRCWSTSSWTAPSTASLFTGVYPLQHGVTTGIHANAKAEEHTGEIQLNRIPEDIETLPVLMKSLGYRTFGIADNPNICDKEGFDRGFDQFAGYNYEGAPKVNGTLGEWVSEIRSSEPWFVYLHYMDPHVPYHEREPWFEPVEPTDAYVEPSARYDSEIAFVDKHIREAFDSIGVDDDTVIVVVSDHGEEFGEHGGRFHGFKLYSELTWVPMMLSHPGMPPGQQRVAANVSILDILPTLRSILGAPPSEQDEGVSLTRYYLDPVDAPEPRHIFAMRTRIRPMETVVKRAVMFEDYKYVFTEPKARQELYDLRSDPREQHNLIRGRRDVANELYDRWRAFEASARRWQAGEVEVTLDDEELEALRALGYTGDK